MYTGYKEYKSMNVPDSSSLDPRNSRITKIGGSSVIFFHFTEYHCRRMSKIKAAHKKILEELLKKDYNKVCADCRAKGMVSETSEVLISRSSLGFCYSRLFHLYSLLWCSP